MMYTWVYRQCEVGVVLGGAHPGSIHAKSGEIIATSHTANCRRLFTGFNKNDLRFSWRRVGRRRRILLQLDVKPDLIVAACIRQFCGLRLNRRNQTERTEE